MAKKKSFLEKKRPAGSSDFGRTKAKVGRKVARRVGETDASFGARTVSLKEQSMLKVNDGAVVSTRGLTMDEHLAQLNHHNERARCNALACIRELVPREASSEQLGACFEASARLASDESRRVRAESLALLRVVVEKGDSSLSRRAQAAVARLGAALSSLDGATRTDAAKALFFLLATRRHSPMIEAARITLIGPLASALRMAKPDPSSSYRPQLVKLASILLTPDENTGDDSSEEDLPLRCLWGRRMLAGKVPQAVSTSPDAVSEIGRRLLEIVRETLLLGEEEDVRNKNRVEEIESVCELARIVCSHGEPVDLLETMAAARRELAAALSSGGNDGTSRTLDTTLLAAAVDEASPAAVDWLIAKKGRPRALARRLLCSSGCFSQADKHRVVEAADIVANARAGDVDDAALLVDLIDGAAPPEYIEALCLSGHHRSLRVALGVARRGDARQEAVAAGATGLVVAARQGGDERDLAAVVTQLEKDIPKQFFDKLLEEPHDDRWNAVVAAVSGALGRDDRRRPHASSFAANLMLATARAKAPLAFSAACRALRDGECPDIEDDDYLLLAAVENVRVRQPHRLAGIVLSHLAADERIHLGLMTSGRRHKIENVDAALCVLRKKLRVREAFMGKSSSIDEDGLLGLARALRDQEIFKIQDLRSHAARVAEAHATDTSAAVRRLQALLSASQGKE